MKRVLVALALVSLSITCLFAWSARAQSPAGWGTVKGRITWGGDKLPEQKPIAAVEMNSDKAHCLSKGPILDEERVVNPKDKGLRWVFVWLMDPKGPAVSLPIHPDLQKIKQAKVEMDQPCCMFVPHALGMRAGQVLLAKNSSPISHNFKWTGNPLNNAGGNVLLPPKGSFPIKDLNADRLPLAINCNIHGWMRAWVRVFSHPYFAVTDEHGSFELSKAPAGNYRLVVWHESSGWLGGAAGKNGQPVTINSGAVTDMGDLQYK